jgi:hypothetical protein
MSIRELIESDLAITLRGDFALPVTLIAPDGTIYEVEGQVLYNSIDENQLVSNTPVVVLQISNLTDVPVAGENWAVRIPQNPDEDETQVTYVLDKPPVHCRSIGFIKLYLTKVVQS